VQVSVKYGTGAQKWRVERDTIRGRWAEKWREDGERARSRGLRHYASLQQVLSSTAPAQSRACGDGESLGGRVRSGSSSCVVRIGLAGNAPVDALADGVCQALERSGGRVVDGCTGACMGLNGPCYMLAA
jgi:hypothetical protein